MSLFQRIFLFPGSPLLLVQLLRRNKRVPFRKWHILALYFLKAFTMLPFSAFEAIFLSRKIRNTEIVHTPVFVIGHYRSGTTFLHKTLTADKQYAYIETFDFLFPYCPPLFRKPLRQALQCLINTFKVQNPHFNNYILNLSDPLEEDMVTIGALTPHSAFWSEIFPQNAEEQFDEQIFFRTDAEKAAWQATYLYCLKKLTRRNKGKRLVLKNPPNTGRLPALLELFPDAKLILIHRNPYRVYFSTLNLWTRILEPKYALHPIGEEERNAIIFALYRGLMGRYLKDKALVPAGNLVEVRYDDFVRAPFEEVRRIYAALGLGGFEAAAGDFEAALGKEKSYKSFRYEMDLGFQDRIYEELGEFVDLWGYERMGEKVK